MHAEALKGKLTYVDTEEGRIEIVDKANGRVIAVDIDDQTEVPMPYGWEGLVGEEVEAVVIDGKIKSIYLLLEEWRIIATADLLMTGYHRIWGSRSTFSSEI